MRIPRGRSRTGQIIIPTLFLFPTFMLLIYLIYDTARLSRDKIRHQFAVDAAVFVEMVNYSDFLNRTAYVNGAFPMRIFDEGFHADPMIPCTDKPGCDGKSHSLWELMCNNGAFPVKGDGSGGNCGAGTGTQSFPTTASQWTIEFGGSGKGKNTKDQKPELEDVLQLLTEDNANGYWINWDMAAQVFQIYTQIYNLLGSVEDAQYSVLTKLSRDHSFLQKSYLLNAGDPDKSGGLSLKDTFNAKIGNWDKDGDIKYVCYDRVNYFGNQPGDNWQPWKLYCPQPKGPLPKDCPGVKMSSSYCDGLFHLMWIRPKLVQDLGKRNGSWLNKSYGIPVEQSWTAPSNYFNVDFNSILKTPTGGPVVHVSVAINGYGGAKASVWPDPTPKFQVRTFP